VKHLTGINQKAARIEAYVAYEAAEARASELDVVGLESRPPHEQQGPHFPLGCSLVFSPGWEADRQGCTAGLCFDCHLNCFWPAHVPDQLNHAPDWTGNCASAQKDWRKLDLIFP
jgi:hypothetical protein